MPFRNFDSNLLSEIKTEFQERFVNVKWFGAKGDGKQDDTNAIQEALNTGYSVFIPSGIYLVKNLAPIAGQIIKGANATEIWSKSDKARRTILKGNGGKDDFVIQNELMTWGVGYQSNSIMISDLTIDGNNQLTNGIRCGNQTTIERVRVENCIKGISNVLASIISNCNICLNQYGIYDSTDSKIKDNVIFENTEFGIYFILSNDNIIANNKIEWNHMGMYMSKSTHNVIEGNIFDRNTTYGIEADQTAYISITGNLFERNIIHHLVIRGSKWSVVGNLFIQKNTTDIQTGEIKPDIAINQVSMGQSLITGNVVEGKMFVETAEDARENTYGLNTINGISDSEIAVPFKGIEIEGKCKKTTVIKYPSMFSINEWSGRVTGYSIEGMGTNGTESADNYGVMEGVTIGLKPDGIHLTIKNIFKETIEFYGNIYMKPTRFTSR